VASNLIISLDDELHVAFRTQGAGRLLARLKNWCPGRNIHLDLLCTLLMNPHKMGVEVHHADAQPVREIARLIAEGSKPRFFEDIVNLVIVSLEQ